MFVVTNSVYPPIKAREVVAIFQKAAATPLPSFMKRVYVLTSPSEAGIKVMGIYEVDDGKVADGIKELTRYFVQFYGVEGFKFTFETMLTAQEAIPLLGR
jgi:hypothetical protein